MRRGRLIQNASMFPSSEMLFKFFIIKIFIFLVREHNWQCLHLCPNANSHFKGQYKRKHKKDFLQKRTSSFQLYSIQGGNDNSCYIFSHYNNMVLSTFTNFSSFNYHNHYMRLVLILTVFYRRGNQPEMVNNLPTVIQ